MKRLHIGARRLAVGAVVISAASIAILQVFKPPHGVLNQEQAEPKPPIAEAKPPIAESKPHHAEAASSAPLAAGTTASSAPLAASTTASSAPPAADTRLTSWADKWRGGHTAGWQRSQPHELLLKYALELGLATETPKTVLFPLCGADVGLGHLARLGHNVVGVEGVGEGLDRLLSEYAINSLHLSIHFYRWENHVSTTHTSSRPALNCVLLAPPHVHPLVYWYGDFGAATHPGVGGGTHRRRATFERC